MTVGGRERREVHELEDRRHGDEGPDAGVSVVVEGGDRREEHHRRDERDRRRRLRIALATENQVPEGVEKRRPEREQEGIERHRERP